MSAQPQVNFDAGPSPHSARAQARRFAGDGRRALSRAATEVAAGLFEATAVFCAVAAWTLYQAPSDASNKAWLAWAVEAGAVVALLFALSSAQLRSYAIEKLISPRGQAGQCARRWNFAFCGVVAFAPFAAPSAAPSLACALALYVIGLGAVVGARLMCVGVVRRLIDAGRIVKKRVLLVGLESEAPRCAQEIAEGGAEVAGSLILREDAAWLHTDLALAVATARFVKPDDVILAIPWSHRATVEAAFDAFMRAPAALHIADDELFSRFVTSRRADNLTRSSVKLDTPDRGWIARAQKRALDIALSLGGLIALAPMFVVIAILIRRESGGPVLFKQTRYGFNQEPFPIYKFRTMSVAENGRTVRAATREDPRVTRVGSWLRRYSLDEFPQLINVLKGEMSLVGPRPHAMAHDQSFAASFPDYARRHNVKPGLTGWAQVNGIRGPIETDEALRARVEHDVYYVRNASLWLDAKIIALTIFSARAHKNAF